MRRAVKTAASPLALGFTEAQATPARAAFSGAVAGDAASPAALARLDAAIGEIKALSVAPILQQAIDALRREDHQAGCAWAIKALERDERSGLGWYLLAIAREKAGDFKSSVKAYEAALSLIPDHVEIANDLGRLAWRMGMKDVAEKLFEHYLARYPRSYEAANNLACAVRDQARYAEAVEILRPAINATPLEPMLWNTLGTVLSEQGDLEAAITFFDEALRLDSDFNKARYNRGNARMALGELDSALEDCETAMTQVRAEDERMMMQLARSTLRIARGEIGPGWDDYEARLSPSFEGVTHFMIDRPRWTPSSELSGKTLLVVGEQGLGDEVLFANILPDLDEAVGADGKLIIALEKRLVPLFQRSFPKALVGGHATYSVDGRTVRAAPFVTDWDSVDLWTTIASPLRRFRRAVAEFPNRDRFLVADPARIAHWRAVLQTAPAGPKVGLLWKRMKLDGARARFFSPFADWQAVLRTPGISFVNLQYGDCADEIARAKAEFDVDIWTPPGIDLKDDLDDVAALSCALDLTLGFANATSNIAAACGAPTWIISVPGAWTRLGTDRMPWYPQTRVFTPPAFGRWPETMQEVAAALATAF